MAHKSKKKHIKHTRQQQVEQDLEVAELKATSLGTTARSPALGAARSQKARLAANARAAVKSAAAMRAAAQSKRASKRPTTAEKTKGIVRSIAGAATTKLTAKPKRMISKAKARVRSLFGREARVAG
jgi:hypothetical protein